MITVQKVWIGFWVSGPTFFQSRGAKVPKMDLDLLRLYQAANRLNHLFTLLI
jgi:hypothetical protein